MPSNSKVTKKTTQAQKSQVTKKQATKSAPAKEEQKAVEQPKVVEAPKVVEPVKTTAKQTKKQVQAEAPKVAEPVKATKKATPAKKGTKKAVTKKPAAKPAQTGGDGSETTEDKNKRFFKLVSSTGESPAGRFSGMKPKQAANKALTTILKNLKDLGEKCEGKFKFSIVECTRGSKHKQYFYEGERVALDEPTEVEIKKEDGSTDTITYHYSNKVYKDKNPEPVPVVQA